MSPDRGELSTAKRAAVQRLVGHLPLTDVNWARTGSVAHVLQGAELDCHDVDIQTDAPGAYEVELRLRQWEVEPVRLLTSSNIQSHFGRYPFADFGVDLEVMGALQKRAADGAWTPPTDPAHHRLLVDLDGVRVPVMSLSYEADAYELLGRADQARLLRSLGSAVQEGSG